MNARSAPPRVLEPTGASDEHFSPHRLSTCSALRTPLVGLPTVHIAGPRQRLFSDVRRGIPPSRGGCEGRVGGRAQVRAKVANGTHSGARDCPSSPRRRAAESRPSACLSPGLPILRGTRTGTLRIRAGAVRTRTESVRVLTEVCVTANDVRKASRGSFECEGTLSGHEQRPREPSSMSRDPARPIFGRERNPFGRARTPARMRTGSERAHRNPSGSREVPSRSNGLRARGRALCSDANLGGVRGPFFGAIPGPMCTGFGALRADENARP